MTNVEELLDKLESCVISRNSIVTYKWISQEWGVHVNTAKQLLFTFTNNGKSKDVANLEVIYFISGILNDGEGSNTYQVSLVREKDVEKAKSKYKNIHSEHVYSVQNSSLKDLHDLYIVDKVDGENVIQGKCGKASIRCEAAIPRSTEAFEKLRAITASTSAKSEPAVKNAQSASVFNGSSSKEDSSKRKEIKEEPTVNGKIKKDEKKGIAGLFAAQTVKNSGKKSDIDSPDVNKESPKNIVQKPKIQKNGIANLFAKQAEKPPAKKPKKEEPKKEFEPVKTAVVEKQEEEDPFASEDEEDVRREIIIEDERSNSPVEVVKKVKAHKNEKVNKKKHKRVTGGEEESPLPSKKRRRIKMMDSSSDEEMEIGESESPIPESAKTTAVSDYDDDIIPATPTESLEHRERMKRKKRIMQDKTFIDDHGYIVTKKEYVFVSCSEDSNDNDVDAKSKDFNSKINSDGTPSPNEVMKEKNDVPLSSNKEDTSPKEKEAGKKGKKGKEEDKSKKTGKKFSPQNVRQGVLTNFFKRTS